MIVDSSALIAILTGEPDAPVFAKTIENADLLRISAATLLETNIVIESRYGAPGGEKLDELMQRMQMQIEPVTASQIDIARAAYRRYGKGRGHVAGLNYGDVFAYAPAKEFNEPLLFKGDDFSETDITPAVSL